MQRPGVLGEQLPRGLVARVRVSVLGAEEEAAEGLDAAAVCEGGVCAGGAGEDGVVVGCEGLLVGEGMILGTVE